MPHTTNEAGAIRIDGSLAWFDCSLEREIVAGDHLLALMHVVDHVDGADESTPLVFHRRRLVSLHS